MKPRMKISSTDWLAAITIVSISRWEGEVTPAQLAANLNRTSDTQ